jgi:hypothetical protein
VRSCGVPPVPVDGVALEPQGGQEKRSEGDSGVTKRSGSKNRQRQKQVAVRLSDEEHALLLAAAEHLEVSPAAVLRYTFLAEYSPEAAGVTRKPG